MKGIIILIIVIVLIIAFISTYNKLISSRMKVKEAFSTMDVYLKKRYDLIPNLVEIVKGYMNYEEETLSKITELRSKSYSSHQEKIENEKEMSSAINKFLAVAENYPELKANAQFLELQKQLLSVEDDIENARRYYNGTVSNLNILVNTIPTNIVAIIAGIKEEPFFETDNAVERENVKINFSK